MFIYLILIIFFITILSFFLCCLTCLSCIGLTGSFRQILKKFSTSSFDRQFTGQRQTINSQCFICLERIKNEVVATCQHGFCADCIVSYIQSKPNEVIQCPACRKEVCILFRRFQPRNDRERTLKDRICQYNFDHSQEPSMMRSIFEIGSLIRQAPRLLTFQGLTYMMSNPRVKTILMLLVYTLSPIDILPEAILGPIGLFDDSIALMSIVRNFNGLLINFVRDQALREGQRERRQN